MHILIPNSDMHSCWLNLLFNKLRDRLTCCACILCSTSLALLLIAVLRLVDVWLLNLQLRSSLSAVTCSAIYSPDHCYFSAHVAKTCCSFAWLQPFYDVHRIGLVSCMLFKHSSILDQAQGWRLLSIKYQQSRKDFLTKRTQYSTETSFGAGLIGRPIYYQ